MAERQDGRGDAKAAAKALSDLNTFAIVATILERGHLLVPSRGAERIIKICEVEQQKLLRAYDRAIAKSGTEGGRG